MVPIVKGWSRSNPFNTVWQQHLSSAAQVAMNAEIEVFYTNIGEAEFDPETGDYTYPETETILYTGKARIQPIRAAVDRDQTQIQTVLVSIPDLSVDVRPKHKMRVVSCAENIVLSHYKYVVHEVVDSSNLIERTFYVKSDTGVIVDGD